MSKLSDLRKKLLSPGGVLLIPMFAIALGIHVALLALPIPSSEALKPADDQKDPIDVTQIPTTPPTSIAAKKTAKTSAPSQANATSAAARTNSSLSSQGAANTATTARDGVASTKASAPVAATTGAKTEPGATDEKAAIAASNSADAVSTNLSSTPANAAATPAASPEPQPSTEAKPATPTAEPSAPASPTAQVTSTADDEPFANFPHYEAAEVDCFGLGFGNNCRTIENGKITEVSAFFRKELPSKAFQVAVVTDTPQHTVLKVSKQGTDRFLNIWQGPTTVSYLLAKVIYKQSPAEIKTEISP